MKRGPVSRAAAARPYPRPPVDPQRLLALLENLSIFDLLEILPDEESCLRFLFALCGGLSLPCPTCGSQVRWQQSGSDPHFRSRCCGEIIDARTDTLFAEVKLEIRRWLYLVATFLNCSAPLSTEFVAAHLEISKDKAWRALAQIRQHIERLNARAFDPANYQRCYVDEFLYRPIRDTRRGCRSRIWLLGLSGEAGIHVIPLQSRQPGAYREAIDQLGLLGANLFSCNLPLALRLREENFLPVSTCEWTMASRGAQLVSARANLSAFWPFFSRSMRRGSVVPNRAHVQRYVADYVFRFNNAGEKQLMLSRFLAGIAPL